MQSSAQQAAGFKMGERITVSLIGRVTPILPGAGLGIGKFLTTLTSDAICENS